MKKLLFFISLFVIILVKVYSQSSVYKVEKDGKSIYIGGTVHLLRAEDYPLPQEFYDAYSKSDILVFEADLKELESPELMTELMTYSQYEEGNSLSKNLSPEVYSKLKEKFESKGLSIEAFETFKPSMVILTLSALSMQEMNIESEGVDQHFINKGEEDEKDFAYLESAKEQMELLTGMGEGNEDSFVLKSLEDLDDMKSGLTGLIDDWKNGTNKIMIAEINAMKKDYPSIYQSLLVDRNNRWIPKIEKLLEDDNVEYILVGSLHLHGEEGVLNLLKEKGYTFSQI